MQICILLRGIIKDNIVRKKHNKMISAMNNGTKSYILTFLCFSLNHVITYKDAASING